MSISTKDIKLFIGTPMYGSKCHGVYLHSVLSLINLCHRIGIQTSVCYLCNESLLQRSRNYVVDNFLRTDFTHLLFIDSDIEFCPEDVITLLSLNQDVVGAPYSTKEIDWNIISHIVKKNENISPQKLSSLAGHWVYEVKNPCIKLDPDAVIETNVLTTGFLLIKRHVFEKLQVIYPEYYYRPDHVGIQHFGGERYIQLFFSVEIDPITQQLTTEYEFFCRLWKNIGGKIYIYPWIILNHIGIHTYEIDLKKE